MAHGETDEAKAMSSPTELTVRFVLCARCGAPLHVELGAFNVACRFCGATGTVLPRRLAAPQPARTPRPERERLALLWQQVRAPSKPPALEELKGLMHEGVLAPWRVDDALRLWRELHDKLAVAPDWMDEHRVSLVSLLLGNHYGEREELDRVRALIEMTLEVLTDPALRQTRIDALVRLALRLGDAAAAESWLATMDPASEVLSGDTAFRVARAMVDLARGAADGALSTVGATGDSVPLSPSYAWWVALVRAGAWEQKGDVTRAAEVLSEYMLGAGSFMRALIGRTVTRFNAIALCARSYPLAEQAVSRSLLAKVAAHTDGSHAARERARWLLQHGNLTTAHVDEVKVVRASADIKVTQVTLTLHATDGRPYKVVTQHVEREYGAREGLDIYVRVNPSDPNDVMLEPT